MKSRCNCPLHLSNNPSYDYCRFGRLDIYIWYKAMSEGAGTNTSGSLFSFIREIWRLIKDCKRPKYIRKFRIFGGKFIFVIDAAFCNPSIFRKGHQSSSVYLELRQQNRPASNSPHPSHLPLGGQLFFDVRCSPMICLRCLFKVWWRREIPAYVISSGGSGILVMAVMTYVCRRRLLRSRETASFIRSGKVSFSVD